LQLESCKGSQPLFKYPTSKNVWEEVKQRGAKTFSRLHLFKYSWFTAKIVGYHTKVVTFEKPRKWLFLLVKPCNLSGNHHSLKSPYIINSHKV